MAGHEVRGGYQIFRLDRSIAEAEVGNRNPAGLLGVVYEISLNIFIGVVADDLDGILVRANRTVRAKAPEHAADYIGRFGMDIFHNLE